MKLTKPKDRPIYRLPDRTTTLSPEKYVEAWRALVAPIERVLGWQCIGFDPSFNFVVYGQSLDLTLGVVEKLAARLEELERQIEFSDAAAGCLGHPENR